ncbi:nuclear transport factor 2 family protein [Pseudomonas sp. BF-RE-26]|uniref:nuclear transport factor 2 family protein n=1 Tax=Pseudomonas sp. BF-RE-26 TaxID=2832396 RepID=UPI001CBD8E19|nr:nuclear transport factor 2 family protein [Pseudomonas sp. BF-RE-26]
MKPSFSDIVEVNQLLSLWGHLVDRRAWHRFDEVLTDDALYDCSIFGYTPVSGIDAIRGMFNQEGHARAHHTTNVYVQDGPGDELIAESKGLGLLGNGAVASVTFLDKLRLTPAGWRLASRALKIEPVSGSDG